MDSAGRLAGTWEPGTADKINPEGTLWGTYLDSWPAPDSPAPQKGNVQLLRFTCELKVRIWAEQTKLMCMSRHQQTGAL